MIHRTCFTHLQKRLTAVLAGLFLLHIGSFATAASSSHRVLFEGTMPPELERKLAAEARAVGLTPVRARDELEEVSEASSVRLEGTTVVLRVSGPKGELVVKTFEDDPRAPDLLAVRVMEDLRALLVKFEVLTPPPSAEPVEAAAPHLQPAPSPAQDRSPRPEATADIPWLWLQTGLGATTASGKLGATLQASLGVRVDPHPSWAASAFVLLPLTENNLSGPEGSADVMVQACGARLHYNLTEPNARLRGDVGLGAGVTALQATGEAVSAFRGRSERLYAGLYFAHGSVAYGVTEWLTLRGTFLLGATAPRPVIRFDEREVASFGRTVAGATLGVDFAIARTTHPGEF